MFARSDVSTERSLRKLAISDDGVRLLVKLQLQSLNYARKELHRERYFLGVFRNHFYKRIIGMTLLNNGMQHMLLKHFTLYVNLHSFVI